MILTCPNCATRYSTTADAIGHNGRTVRCSSCATTWFVTAEPDILDLQEQEKQEQVIIDTPPEELDTVSADPELDGDYGDVRQQPMGAHVQIRDMADQRRRNKSLMGVYAVWFATLAILGSMAFYAFNNRQSIVEKYPGTATIYKIFGMETNAIGLQFEDPTIRRLPVDGVETLVINGHIINITDETRPIPMLELSIVNKSEEVLASWVIEPPQSELEAKGRIPYSSEYQNPPIDGEKVLYKFLKDDEWIDPENVVGETPNVEETLEGTK